MSTTLDTYFTRFPEYIITKKFLSEMVESGYVDRIIIHDEFKEH